MSTVARAVRGEEAAREWKKIQHEITEAAIPHREKIAEICADGDIAILVLENLAPRVKLYARQLGWRPQMGTPAVLRMTDEDRKRLAECDTVTEAWCGDRAHVRILVLMEAANFLVNVRNGRWQFEPGSRDGEGV